MSKLMRAQEVMFADESKGRAILSMKPSDLQQAQADRPARSLQYQPGMGLGPRGALAGL